MLLVAGSGCEAPAAPTWDVDLTLPITHRVDTMADLLEDLENMGVDSLGTVALTIEQTIEPITIDDELRVDPFTDSASYELGAIEIETPAPREQAFTFVEVWPPAAIFGGQYHRVQPFGFQVESNLPAFDSFVNATLEQATCQVLVDNGLPVPLESAELTFRNVVSGTVVGSAILDRPVGPGQIGTANMDLAGARLESQIAVAITGQAGGSEGPILVDPEATIRVELSFLGSVTVSAAVTTVDPQTVVRTEAIALGGGSHRGEVEFLDGDVDIAVQNASNLTADVTVTLLEFFDAAGDTVRGLATVPAGGNRSIPIALGGRRFVPATGGEARVRVRMVIDSGGRPVAVAATDRLEATVRLARAARAASFQGVLDPIEVTIDPVSSEIDLPAGLDQVAFAGAVLTLELWNSAGFPIDLDAELVGTNADLGRVMVPVRGRVAAATGTGRARTLIVLDESNSNIVELINLMPTTIDLGGTAVAGDGVTQGDIERGDFVEGTVRLEAPLELELGPDRVTTDPDQLDLDEETRDTIRDDVSAGEITATITNHLPLGGVLHLVLSRTAAGAEDPEGTGNLVLSGRLAMPAIGPDSEIEAAAVSQLSFELDKDDLRIFEQASLYSGVVFDLDGGEGRTVRFRATDWVEVRAVAVLRTRVDLD